MEDAENLLYVVVPKFNEYSKNKSNEDLREIIELEGEIVLSKLKHVESLIVHEAERNTTDAFEKLFWQNSIIRTTSLEKAIDVILKHIGA